MITIALIQNSIPERELARPFQVRLLSGIEAAAFRRKASIVTTFPEVGLSSSVSLAPADGAILMGPRPPRDMAQLAEVYPRRVVFSLQEPSVLGIDAVELNLAPISVALVDDLAARGYQRIAHVGWSVSGIDPYDESRTRALVTRLREREMFAPGRVLLGEEGTAEVGRALARRLFQQEHRPDAIIAATDSMALGVYRAAYELGLSVPRDVAVVGYNDNPISALMSPSLSTIAIPAEKLGGAAIDLLFEQMQGRTAPKRVVFEGEMIWRESTG